MLRLFRGRTVGVLGGAMECADTCALPLGRSTPCLAAAAPPRCRRSEWPSWAAASAASAPPGCCTGARQLGNAAACLLGPRLSRRRRRRPRPHLAPAPAPRPCAHPRSGARVTLYESEESCGGHTLTDTSSGYPVDLGFQVGAAPLGSRGLTLAVDLLQLTVRAARRARRAVSPTPHVPALPGLQPDHVPAPGGAV